MCMMHQNITFGEQQLQKYSLEVLEGCSNAPKYFLNYSI